MNLNKSNIASLAEKYKNQINVLSNEVLLTVHNDRNKALEYAKKGIDQNEPEKRNDEYITLVADSMQILARTVLKERGILFE